MISDEYIAVFPCRTPDDVIARDASFRARANGLIPAGDISVSEHVVKAGAVLVAIVRGTRPSKPKEQNFFEVEGASWPIARKQGRKTSTLDRPVLWPKRKSTPGALRSGSSGER